MIRAKISLFATLAKTFAGALVLAGTISCGEAPDSQGGAEQSVESKAKKVSTYSANWTATMVWSKDMFGTDQETIDLRDESQLFQGQLTQKGLESAALPPIEGVQLSVGLKVNVHVIGSSSVWFKPSEFDSNSYRLCINEVANDNMSHWYGINPEGTGWHLNFITTSKCSCAYWLFGKGKDGGASFFESGERCL